MATKAIVQQLAADVLRECAALVSDAGAAAHAHPDEWPAVDDPMADPAVCLSLALGQVREAQSMAKRARSLAEVR